MQWCVTEIPFDLDIKHPTLHRIGITGGIGSGKSVVSRFLRCNGFRVYDCDYEAKRLMHGDKIRKEIISLLGEKSYSPSGKLNKSFLAEKLFGDISIREAVNRIVHQEVLNDVIDKSVGKEGLFFIESAILISAGLASYCEKIWIVDAPLSVKMQRISMRDNLSAEEIEKRIQSQQEEFSLLLNHRDADKIKNDGNQPLIQQIINLLNQNIKKYA